MCDCAEGYAGAGSNTTCVGKQIMLKTDPVFHGHFSNFNCPFFFVRSYASCSILLEV